MLNLVNLLQTAPPYLFTKHFNIILPHASRCSKVPFLRINIPMHYIYLYCLLFVPQVSLVSVKIMVSFKALSFVTCQ